MEGDPAVWHPWFVLCTIILLFGALVSGWKTPDMAAFMALCLVWNAGIIDTQDAISGFTNTGVLAVGVLFVVVQAVERSQLALVMARRAFGMNTGIRFGLARLCTLCFAISGFLNNTPVVALLTPITRDWARTRGFSPSTFLIPLSYSTIFGGLLTTVGTSTNLVVMGLAEDMDLQIPGFFDIALVGFPVGLVGIIYLVLVGPILLPKTGGLLRYAKDNQRELVTEVQVEKTFKYLGQPVGLALAMLGLHRDCLVKIRRLRHKKAHIPQPSDSSPVSISASMGEQEPAGPGSTSVGGGSTTASQHVTPAVSTDGQSERGAEEETEERLKRGVTRMEVLHGGVEVEEVMAGVEEVMAGVEGAGGVGGRVRKGKVVCSKKVMFHGCDTAKAKAEDASAEGGCRVEFVDLYPVSMNELLQEGDVLFMSGGNHTFMALHNSINNGIGLKIMEGVDDLAGQGMEFVEVVLSQRNPFVGDIVAASSLGQHYGISILAIRQKGQQTENVACVEPSHPNSERRLSLDLFSLDRSRFSLDSKRSPRSGTMDYARFGGGAAHRGRGASPQRAQNSTSPDLFPGFAASSGSVEDMAPLSLAKAQSEPLHSTSDESRDGEVEAAAAAGVGQPEQSEAEIMAAAAAAVAAEPADSTEFKRKLVGPPSAEAGGEEVSSEGDDKAEEMEVGRSKLFSGDVVLALAPEGFAEKWAEKEDFLMVSTIGNVPKPIVYYDYVPVAIFAAMIAWVAADPEISMVQAAMAAAALNVFGGWVDAKLAVSYVPWDLMLLIGSMLGVSRAITNSGVAEFIAAGVKNAGFGPHGALFFVYAVTNIMTELTTNNAAAGLIFPIAIGVADKLEVSYMPYVFGVMCAASASFMTPIGYQTNMMVWGPGGYKFLDFTKIGAPLSAIYMVSCCILIPLIWRFEDGPMVE